MLLVKCECPFKFFCCAGLSSLGWSAKPSPHDAHENVELPNLAVNDILCVLADIGECVSFPTHGLQIHINEAGNDSSQFIDDVRCHITFLGNVSW